MNLLVKTLSLFLAVAFAHSVSLKPVSAQDTPTELFNTTKDKNEYFEETGFSLFIELLKTEHDIGLVSEEAVYDAENLTKVQAYRFSYLNASNESISPNAYYQKQTSLKEFSIQRVTFKTVHQLKYMEDFVDTLRSMLDEIHFARHTLKEEIPLNSNEVQALAKVKDAAISFKDNTLRPRLRDLTRDYLENSKRSISDLLMNISEVAGCSLSDPGFQAVGVSPLIVRVSCRNIKTVSNKEKAAGYLLGLNQRASSLLKLLELKTNEPIREEIMVYNQFRSTIRNWEEELRLTSLTESDLQKKMDSLKEELKSQTRVEVTCEKPKNFTGASDSSTQGSLILCYQALRELNEHFLSRSAGGSSILTKKAFQEIRIVHRDERLKAWNRDYYESGDLIEISSTQSLEETRDWILSQPDESDENVQQRRQWQKEELAARNEINRILQGSFIHLNGCDSKHFFLKGCLDDTRSFLKELRAQTNLGGPLKTLQEILVDLKSIPSSKAVELTLSNSDYTPVFDEPLHIMVDARRINDADYQEELVDYAKTYLNLKEAESLLNDYQGAVKFSVGCDIRQPIGSKEPLCLLGSESLLEMILDRREPGEESNREIEQFINAIQGKIRGRESDSGNIVKEIWISNTKDEDLYDDKLVLDVEGPLDFFEPAYRWYREKVADGRVMDKERIKDAFAEQIY